MERQYVERCQKWRRKYFPSYRHQSFVREIYTVELSYPLAFEGPPAAGEDIQAGWHAPILSQ
jgi:hypothetical protein